MPSIVWMGMIFLASSDSSSAYHSAGLLEPLIRFFWPNTSAAAFEHIHTFARKAGHFSEYGVLGLFFLLGHSRTFPGHSWMSKMRVAILLSAFYAGTDEFHQLFVPTRTALVSDVLIDTLGAATALLVLHFFKRLRKSHGVDEIPRVH